MAARKNKPDVRHDTIVIERTFEATPAQVFEAWRDVEVRKVWSQPVPSVDILYEKADFREGGVDVVYCSSNGDMRWRFVVQYFDIVDGERIVCTEDMYEADVRQAVTLLAVEFAPSGKATKMKFTAQIAAFGAMDTVEGYVEGWGLAFDNLERQFKQEAVS